MDVLDSIARTLSSTEEDEELWMGVQYFSYHKHCQDIHAKMIPYNSLELLGNEFFSLIAQEKRPIMSGLASSISKAKEKL